MFGVQTWRRFAACSRGCAGPCMHEWHPGMHYGPFATCEEALSVASGLIRGGVRLHDDAETSVIVQGSAVIAVVSPRRSEADFRLAFPSHTYLLDRRGTYGALHRA